MMNLIAVILLIGVAFWIYSDASSKGRSPLSSLLWAAGAVFAPYIAIPVYFLMRWAAPPTRSNQETIFKDTGQAVVTLCSRCGYESQRAIKKCPKCKNTLKGEQ